MSRREIKILDKIKKNMPIVLMISLIFGTKGYLLLAILPLIYLVYKKETTKEEFFEIFKEAAYYKFMVFVFYRYGNMEKEAMRMLFAVFFVDIFYFKKKINLKNNILPLIFVGWYALGIVWSYLSPGETYSLNVFYKKYYYLVLPFVLNIILENREKVVKYTKILFSVSIIGFFIDIGLGADNIDTYKSATVAILPLITTYSFLGIFTEKNMKVKIMNFLLSSLGLFIVIKSEVRGALLALIIGYLIGLILKFKWKGIIVSLLLFGGIYFSLREIPRYKERFLVTETMTTRLRISLRKAGIYTFKENIIFGSGVRNSQKYFKEFAETDFKPESYLKNEEEVTITKNELNNFPDSHNIFIDYLSEYGILGIFICVLLLIYIPLDLFIFYFKGNNDESIRILGSIGAFYAAGLSWSIWTRHSGGIPFFIIILWFYFYTKSKTRNRGTN